MAKKDKKTRAQEILSEDDYLKEVLGLIPEDKMDAVLERLGDKMLKQDEFSRHMDELREEREANDLYKQKLDDWYGANLQAIEAGTKVLNSDHDGGAPSKPEKKDSTPQTPQPQQIDLSGYIKKTDLERYMAQKQAEIEQRTAAMGAFLLKVDAQNQRDFGERLDVETLYAHAAKKNFPNLNDAYLDMTKEKRAEVMESRAKEERKKIEAEVREKIVKEQSGAALPFPVAGGGVEPSTLTGLGTGKEKSQANSAYGVQAAVDEYYRTAAANRT